MSDFTLIPMKDIHPDDEFNSRGEFSRQEVADLARDIQENADKMPETFGLVQPISIRPYSAEKQQSTGFKYQLVAGYRRFFAFKSIGHKEIPAIVREHLDDQTASYINLSENIHRKDLNIVQEAKALKKLFDFGATQEEVSKRLNVSKNWVQVRYQLLQMPEDIQKEAEAGVINQYHIKQIYGMNNTQRYEAVRKIKDHALKGARKADLEIKKVSQKPNQKKVRSRPEVFEMIEHLGKTVGYGLHTRIAAWIVGEISNEEFYMSCKEYADENGLQWQLPNLTGAAA